jgi:hypothetical protein
MKKNKIELINSTFDFSDGSCAMIGRGNIWMVILENGKSYKVDEDRSPQFNNYTRAKEIIKLVRKSLIKKQG